MTRPSRLAVLVSLAAGLTIPSFGQEPPAVRVGPDTDAPLKLESAVLKQTETVDSTLA